MKQQGQGEAEMFEAEILEEVRGGGEVAAATDCRWQMKVPMSEEMMTDVATADGKGRNGNGRGGYGSSVWTSAWSNRQS